jgi:flagellar basal body-associated protein FliL
MKDFLDFLNTASLEELTGAPQISGSLAEKIIAARPLVTLEDALKIKGVTQTRLDGLKAHFETPAVVEVTSVPEEESVVEPVKKRTSIAGIILRILIALLVLGAIFALVYYGVPWFKQKVLDPLQSNTERVSELTSQHASDIDRLTTELTALQERITTLESRADGVDQSIQAHSEALAKLDELQAALQTAIDEHKAQISSQVAEQLALTRAIELLSRCRLYMSQNNFGLARADAQSARELLFGLLSTISPDQSGALRIVIQRLDLALSNMETYPVIAVYDLDTAWRLLVDGLPNVPQAVQTPVISGTFMPTTIPQVTPTALP